ncbi:TPA: DinB family protein [Serratia marcescens]
MSLKKHLEQLFNYKQWADAEAFAAIRKVDADAWPKQRHLMLRLMNHIYVVDQIFIANLQGQRHGYTALNTQETPTLEALEEAMLASDRGYLAYIVSLSEAQLDERIHFTFVDGGPGDMLRREMLAHVEHHGCYHRGAVGWLITESAVKAPQDVLTVFVRDGGVA